MFNQFTRNFLLASFLILSQIIAVQAQAQSDAGFTKIFSSSESKQVTRGVGIRCASDEKENDLNRCQRYQLVEFWQQDGSTKVEEVARTFLASQKEEFALSFAESARTEITEYAREEFPYVTTLIMSKVIFSNHWLLPLIVPVAGLAGVIADIFRLPFSSFQTIKLLSAKNRLARNLRRWAKGRDLKESKIPSVIYSGIFTALTSGT